MKRIGFVTSALDPELTHDDRLAVIELKKLGIEVTPVIWDRAAPAGLELLVLRSCWDYYEKAAQFRSWLQACGDQGIPLANSPKLALWNLDKAYLKELGRKGAEVPKTLDFKAGQRVNLRETLLASGLDEVVIKPAVSMLGFDTWRASLSDASRKQQEFQALLDQKDVLLQRFIPEILTTGEISSVFFDGEFSHAIRKIPRHGEFRIHEEHGGTRAAHELPASSTQEIRKILASLPEPPLYARVDCVPSNGRWVLMEIELIDPHLFMSYSDGAPARFAQAIARRLDA